MKVITTTLLSISLFIWGCSSIFHDNGVTKTASDTYKIIRHGNDSLELRDLISQEADKFCQEKSLYVMPVSTDYSRDHYEMEFRCLAAGDPELIKEQTPYPNKRYQKKLGGFGNVTY